MKRRRMLAIGMMALSLALALSPGFSAAQDSKTPRVGIILLAGPGQNEQAIRQGFARLGYTEGKSIITEFRFAQGQHDRVPGLAAELVRLNVDVIVAVGAVGVQAARQATSQIPIVFSAVLDPVALGFAASLERPGGNITGITSFDPQQAAKQFEMLKELNPRLARVAILSDQAVPRTPDGWNPYEKAYDNAARALGLEPQWLRVKGPSPELPAAFEAMINERAEALLVMEMPVTIGNFGPIAELAARHRLPTMFPAGWPTNGLVAYGTSILNATPRVPEYVDKILKGAKAGELPIEVITKRELIFNLKTARQIGVTVPPELLRRADRVVE